MSAHLTLTDPRSHPPPWSDQVCTAAAAGTSPPDFTQRAEPSFPRGGVVQDHRRVVLKSKDAVPGSEGFAHVSQRLGIAAGDVPAGDDVDGALGKLLEKAGK